MAQTTGTQRSSEQAGAQFNTDRTHPGWWTITFSNPPIESVRFKVFEMKGTNGLLGSGHSTNLRP
jgi:hypothetical protein